MINHDSLPVRAAGLRGGKLSSPVTIRFTKPERDRLGVLAQEHGVSVADVVRCAVDGLLRGNPSTHPARSVQVSPKKPSPKRGGKSRFRTT